MNAGRNGALTAILVLLSIHALYVARSLLLPVAVALLAYLALSPLVRALRRLHVPTALGAALVLGSTLGLVGVAGSFLMEPAAEWMERLPESARDIERKLRFLKQPLAEMSEATQTVEAATSVDTDPQPTVQMQQPSLAETLLINTQAFLTTTAIALVFLYFLLASGDRFLQRAVVAFARVRSEARALELLRETEREISRYLFTISLVNLGLGVAVAGLLFALEVPSPFLWGALAAVSNFMPYVGALLTAVVLSVVALLSFDEPTRAFVVPLCFLMVTTLEGWLVTPLLVGRQLLLSPVVVLAGILLWSWLWGIPGALLAVPSLVVLKIVCDHTPSLAPLGSVLSGGYTVGRGQGA